MDGLEQLGSYSSINNLNFRIATLISRESHCLDTILKVLLFGMATQKQAVRKQPSREKLAEYVYEYLVFIGAQNTAQSFMNEYMQPSWNKSVPSTGDNQSFLLSWWSIFWELFSTSTDLKPDSPEAFEVSKTLQDMVSTSLTSDIPTTDQHNFFAPGPGTSLAMDSKPQSLHSLVSPNISQNYTLSPTTSYPTTNLARYYSIESPISEMVANDRLPGPPGPIFSPEKLYSTPPTPWAAPFTITHPEDIAVSHSHIQCTPLSDSDMTHQKNAAIMMLKETLAKEATQFEDPSYPPNTFTDNTVP